MAKQAVAKKNEAVEEVQSKAVAVASNNAVAAYDDELLAMLNEDAGMGVSTSQDDNILPLIYILQAQSKQVLKQKPEYIKGAEAGNIWPKGSKTLIGGEEGMPVVLGAWRKWWMEWKPERAGLAGKHEFLDKDPNNGRPRDAKQIDDPKTGNKIWVRDNGNELVELREHALVAFINGEWVPFVVGMKGSDHKTAREWNGDRLRKRIAKMGSKTPPCYAFVYTLKTVARGNDKGDWYGWAWENGMGDGAVTETVSIENGGEVLKLARELGKAYMSGAKNAETYEDLESGVTIDNDDGGDEGDI